MFNLLPPPLFFQSTVSPQGGNRLLRGGQTKSSAPLGVWIHYFQKTAQLRLCRFFTYSAFS